MAVVARGLRDVRGEAASVVGDREAGVAVLEDHADVDAVRVAVRHHVAQGLLGRAEHERLGVGLQAQAGRQVDARLHAPRLQGRDEVGQGGGEARTVQIGRVDIDEERAQLANATSCLPCPVAQGLGDGGRLAVDAVRGGGQGVRRAREVLDDSVVQVARDPPALGVRGGQRAQQQLLALLAVVVERASHAIGERELEELEQEQRADERRREQEERLLRVSVTDRCAW